MRSSAVRHARLRRRPDDPGRAPRHAAAALLEVVDSGNAPSLLLLGNDAADRIRGSLDELRAELDAWDTVSRSTDFDDVAAGA